jgi:hypothetical protein
VLEEADTERPLGMGDLLCELDRDLRKCEASTSPIGLVLRTCTVSPVSTQAVFSRANKPADLPVQQATKIELSKALGFTFPTALLVRADEVIE